MRIKRKEIFKTVKIHDDFYGDLEGFEMDEFVLPKLQEFGLYEPHIIDAFKIYLEPGTHAIDVGANIGLHSIAMIKIEPRLLNVIAVEPHPTIFKILKKNVEKLKFVEAINMAASDRSIEFEMRSLTGSNNPGGAKVFKLVDEETKPDFKVKSFKLDDLTFSKRVSMIKVDVEGHEFETLVGAINLIKKHRPVLIVEIWDGVESESRAMKLKFMSELGYKVEKLSEIDFLFLP